MIKKLLFFILFLGSFIVHGQEVGILIKSTLYPYDKLIGWHSAKHIIKIGQNSIQKGTNSPVDVIEYDFFYVNDNPTEINCIGSYISSIDGNDCKVGEYPSPPYNIPYNKYDFRYSLFNGCTGSSEIMGIYIPQPDTNQKCAEEVMTLTNGWNWQYKYNDGEWTDFPSQFQEQTSISFKIKDLGGHENKSQIYFHAGYGVGSQAKYTNTRSYDIIGCSPELVDKKPITTNVKCNNESSGSATLQFKTELKDNQEFLFNLFKYNTDLKDFDFLSSASSLKKDIKNNTYIWNNIAHGTYFIKYQAQTNTETNDKVGSSAIKTDSFIIEDVQPLTFNLTGIQPKCSTDKGGVLITVKGGTSPYYYILDNETKKLLIKNPDTITLSKDGDHKVIVVDSNNCIEK
jgi:hypothetical protein